MATECTKDYKASQADGKAYTNDLGHPPTHFKHSSPTYNVDIESYDIHKYEIPGKYIIFNHQHFDNEELEIRNEAESDVEVIQKTFDNLGFSGEIHQDLTKLQIMKQMKIVSKRNYSNCGSLVVFILTYGTSETRLWAKDIDYPFESLVESFNHNAGLSLRGKPKVFFIQAPRSPTVEVESSSLIWEVQGSWDVQYVDMMARPLYHGVEAKPQQSLRFPVYADLLFNFVGPPGYEQTIGSKLIQAVCETIQQNATLDMETVGSLSRRRAANRSFGFTPTCVISMSTLTKRFYLSKTTDSALDTNDTWLEPRLQ